MHEAFKPISVFVRYTKNVKEPSLRSFEGALINVLWYLQEEIR